MGLARLPEQKKALALRKRGMSYGEISERTGVGKGTLSIWLRGLPLSTAARSRIAARTDHARKANLARFNVTRSRRICQEDEEAFAQGKAALAPLGSSGLLLAGIALYWGEGTKRSLPGKGYLSFANTDAGMIRLYMRFLRESLNVQDVRIRAGIHAYPSIDDKAVRRYWARITGLPENRFYIVRQMTASSKQRRGNRTPYGTVVIRVYDRRLFSFVKGGVETLALGTA